jgi:hypothetical protein
MPVQDATLQRREREVDPDPEEANGEGQRVHVLVPVPMNSSAVNEMIREMLEEMRSPVQMYCMALGRVIRYRRS